MKGLCDRWDIGMMLIKVLVCDPGRITVLWTHTGKLGRETDLGVDWWIWFGIYWTSMLVGYPS